MSRRRPSRKKYAETIGEIAIEWNLLERKVDVLGFHYLGGDVDVASRIFQGMGNQSKEEFIRYLVSRFEPDEDIAALATYLLRAVSTLRENRNTLLHASPINTFTLYHGRIVKPHKHGHTMHFNVPIEVLEKTAEDMRHFVAYAVELSFCVIAPNDDRLMGGPSMREAMKRTLSSSPTKPPLPRKIEPLPPPEDQPNDEPQPQSSEA
jgi:hypothetical protein